MVAARATDRFAAIRAIREDGRVSSRINYITLAELEATLGIGSSTPGSADRTAAIASASRAIDKICQRVFDPGSGPPGGSNEPETRYYNPDQVLAQEIDDVYTTSDLVLATDNDGDGTFETTWTLGTDFDLDPLNAVTDGEPYTRIRVRANSNNIFIPHFTNSVKLTAFFGWASVPDDIVNATTLLASRVYQLSRNAPLDVMPGGVEGMIRLGSKIPNVMLLLGPYQRHKISVA